MHQQNASTKCIPRFDRSHAACKLALADAAFAPSLLLRQLRNSLPPHVRVSYIVAASIARLWAPIRLCLSCLTDKTSVGNSLGCRSPHDNCRVPAGRESPLPLAATMTSLPSQLRRMAGKFNGGRLTGTCLPARPCAVLISIQRLIIADYQSP
jgi:hypothetical protein